MDTHNATFPSHQDGALRARLAELEETLHAIRTGQVDALVDGTDIYTLESAESASNRFRGQVLPQISETVIAVNNDHLITFINEAAEKQYGRQAADVIGLPLSALYAYRWMDPKDERVALDGIRDHGHWRGENIHVKRNGELLHVESVLNVLRDENGDRIGLLAVMRDITQLVKDREALAESARHKDQFLATLAHELRNPLAPLKNGLQLMELAPDDPQIMETTRAMMVRQLDHLVRLVDDLMDLSRISRGKIQLVKADIELRSVITTALETNKPLIEKRGHHLQVELTSEALMVHGDADRLTQVVSNLLNNAAKYTPAGGRIELWVGADSDQAVIRVKDNGIGIDQAAMPKVFDMFAQVDPNQKTEAGGGLGIGLNVVKRLAQMHHGQVEGHSEGLGKGSEFIVRLPLIAGAGDPMPVEDKDTRPIDRRRVLVVDDNEDIAMSMSLILKKYGHVVEVAHDGQHAVDMAASFKPDVILMDIGMPRMNGYEACAAIRGTEHGKRIHIIAVSGWGQEEDRRKSHAAGFDGHVVKPMEKATMERVIAQAEPHEPG
jgi:PAS domain S-box-containing protein